MSGLSRRQFLTRCGSASVGAAALSACSHNSEGRSQRSNIILIYTDDQGYGDMSAFNPDARFQTPNMDRITNEGISFTDAHSSDAVCSPSRYSLLTGRYCWRTSLKKRVLQAHGDCLIPNHRMTLASLLRDNGYHTAMFGKWHLQMQLPGTKGNRDWSRPITDGPIEKGFEYFFGLAGNIINGPMTFIKNDRVTEIPSMWTRKKLDPSIYQSGPDYYRLMPPYDTERKGKADIEVAPNFIDSKALEVFAGKAVDYIEDKAKDSNPFFIYMALTAPHLPHCPGEEFVGKSAMGVYGDFMMETDYRVGQVLDALDAQGLTENTLVILSSDNGAETNYVDRIEDYGHYSNGRNKGGKRDIYEGGHRVPLVMRWPGAIQPGSVCEEPVCQTDLLATFANMLGATLPDNAGEDSYNLMHALNGDDFDRPLRGPIIHHSSLGYFAIREGNWKLNLFRGSGGSLQPIVMKPGPGETPFELYDLATDPHEETNLYDIHPEVVNRLQQSITDIVRNGRSTPGIPQSNDGDAWWPQLTWMKNEE
jgi:arylsulfatase A